MLLGLSTSNRLLTKSCLAAWRKVVRKRKRYFLRRDLFYKKLLVFNYYYILQKYFRIMKNYNRQLITDYYRHE